VRKKKGIQSAWEIAREFGRDIKAGEGKTKGDPTIFTSRKRSAMETSELFAIVNCRLGGKHEGGAWVLAGRGLLYCSHKIYSKRKGVEGERPLVRPCTAIRSAY